MSSVAPPNLGAKEPISKTVSFGDRVLDSKVLPYMRSRNIEFIAKRMRPLTQVFPFFNGVDVGKFVIPKLIEIRMTSGVFQVSETVVGSFDSPNLPKIKFRVAVQNHKYGNYDFPEDIFDINPYNPDLKIPASYSSTSTILNIDTFSLSDRTSDFLGYIANGMKLRGSTSKAEAVITDIRLITNDDGVVIGSFFIPDPNVDVNPVFEAGIRPFRLTSSRNNSLVFGTYTTAAEENYNAEGKVNMVQENAIITRPMRVETNITQVINVVGGPANPVSVPVDPGYIPTKDPGRSGNTTYTVPTPPPPPAPPPQPAPPPAPAPTPRAAPAPAPAPAPAAAPSGLTLISKEGGYFGSGAKNEPPTIILIDNTTNTQQNTDITTLQNLAKEAGLSQDLQKLIFSGMNQASLNLITNELNKTSYMANASIRTTAVKNADPFASVFGQNLVTRSISGSTGASVPITTTSGFNQTSSTTLASSIKPLTSFAENLRTAQSNIPLSSPLLNSTLGISLGVNQASVAANQPSTAAPAPSSIAAAFNAAAGGSYLAPRPAPAPAPSPPTIGQPASTPARPAFAPAPRPAPPPAPPPKSPFLPPPAPAPSKAPAPAPIGFGSGLGRSFTKFSDIRLKKNIVSINSALSKLVNITVFIK